MGIKNTLLTLIAGATLACAHTPGKSKPFDYSSVDSEEVREKIEHIRNVKEFGQSFGHSPSKHYSKYAPGELGKERSLCALYVTTKTHIPRTRLPLLFYKHDAKVRHPVVHVQLNSRVDTFEDEEEYYKSKGYDVYRRCTTQYSAPGMHSQITDDFLANDLVEQADTVLHEETHATLKNLWEMTLHESIASFVGTQGAVLYFQHSGDKENEEIAQKRKEHYADYARDINGAIDSLRAIYSSSENKAIKLEKREALLDALSEKYGREINNAVLWDWGAYTQDYETVEALYESTGDMSKTLETLKGCVMSRPACLSRMKRITARNNNKH